MGGVIPLPTTRVSGMLVRERLLAQLQGDQLDLFSLQNQISTGRRFTLPSEDAPAAQRAITLQRLIERKTQLKSNVDTGQSFLASTDVALNDVAQLLGDIRGAALGVAGTTSTPAERQQVVAEVNRAIEELLAVGNTQFRGRYLFAGSQTNIQPYSYDGSHVQYAGNAKSVNNFSDLGVLFATNAPGISVFGGISDQVLGGSDLDPQVTADTLLSSLRNGRGISANGAIQISDGTKSVIVDVSRAVTVGDVARLIETSAPPGRSITASITGKGITLQLDAAGGGNLSVTEVASGKAARELGLLNSTGVGVGPLVGSDLDPVMLATTRVSDLLGTRASARLISPGGNNDLLIRAAENGAEYSGVRVQIVDDELLRADAGLAAGNERVEFSTTARQAQASLRFSGIGNDLQITASAAGDGFNNVRISIAGATGIGDAASASYDPVQKRLTITVDDAGATSLDAVVGAINGTGIFTAAADASAGETYDGAQLVSAADIGAVQGDTGNSGGGANTLYVFVAAGSSTANQAAAAINAQGTFTAQIDPLDTVVASQAGAGPVSIDAMTITAGGTGSTFDLAGGILVDVDGVEYELDTSGVKSVQDLINVFNGSGAGLHAEINSAGTGINVLSRLSGAYFRIDENGGQTAAQLGIRSFTAATRLDDMNRGVGVPTKADTLLGSVADSDVITDFTIVADDGAGGSASLDIDVRKAATVQDVLNLVNNHPLNNTGGVAIVARVSAARNGIEIVDVAGRPLTINAAEGSQAAEYLGLMDPGATTVSSATGSIQGVDRNYLETSSVFTTLIRLRDALAADDLPALERAIAEIDVDIDRATAARSDVGARQQALDISARNLEDEDVQLQSALSSEIDVDLVDAISNLTARQLSLEASLRTTANILQMSLLNFL
jgi:flagellar hook-associated protein 3 FlgL